VVDGLSFTVQPGEIVGLVGPNGSGKTTTINLISGVIPIDYEQIFLQGRPIQR
jgi:branched-chain amino acid transport system ATP-binding protein